MKKSTFAYVTYISAPPKKVWNALTAPEITAKYWQVENDSDWKRGSRWEHRSLDKKRTLMIIGKVVEFAPPRRLVLTWADPADEGNKAKYSRVTISIEPFHGVSRLTVTHDRLEARSGMLAGISDGWPKVLASLKSLLETGKPLPMLW